MAHTGPPAKALRLGRASSADWTDVPDTPYEGPSPDLPRTCNRRKWHEAVSSWYDIVRRMPHCVLWQPADWLFAVETAYLKQAFWDDFTGGEVKSTLATEIRRREDQMGTTGEARRKLRIRYVNPEAFPDEDASVPDQGDLDGEVVQDSVVRSIADRRRRLTAAG